MRRPQRSTLYPHTTGSRSHQLAYLYQQQGKYLEAEPLYLRALSIYEQAYGPEHPSTAATLHQLASLYQQQGKHPESYPLYLRALPTSETLSGPHHTFTPKTVNNYTSLYDST